MVSNISRKPPAVSREEGEEEEEDTVGTGDIGPIFASQASCPKPEHN